MKMLTAKDLKEILGIALVNVYKLMDEPDFPAIKVSNRRIVVPEDMFIEWIKKRAAKHE